MAVSDSAKVDLLYKKLFGVAKTDLPANKSPSNEAIASPSLLRGDNVWQQAASIPGTAAATAGIVQAYTGASAVQCTADTTSTPISSVYPSWKTNLADWIPSEFGSTYFVQVWVDSSGVANPTATGTQIFDSGIAGVGEWNFDYQSGVLNFIGGTIPASLTVSKVIYVVGYRYIGAKGIANFTSGLTIGNITISGNTITGNSSGISFGSNIFVGNIFYGNGSPFASSNYGNTQMLANLAANSAANISVLGNITANYFIGNAAYMTGLGATYSNASASAYFLTYTGNISAGNVIVQNSVYTDTISANVGNVVTINGTGALRVPVGNASNRPSGINGYIRFNTDTPALEYYDGSIWVPITNTVTDQQITPDGNNATFTLDQTASTVGVIVSINGVLQQPTVAYSISGTYPNCQITFTETPQATDIIDIRFLGAAVTINSTLSDDLIVSGNITATGNISATGSILAVPAWTSAGAITFGATTTAPTKPTTRVKDNISYRQLGAKQWEVIMSWQVTSATGAVAGSGDFLFTLPNSLQFDTTLPSQSVYTSNVGTSTWAHIANTIPSGSGMITNLTVGGQVFPMVYSSTQFRILAVTSGSGVQAWGSGFFSLTDNSSMQLTFRFTSA